MLGGAAVVIGAWELILTRVASALFFYDLAFLVLAASLFALGVGAMLALRYRARPSFDSSFRLCALLLLSPLLVYPWLYYFTGAWLSGVFALPFLLFGMLSALAWCAIQSVQGRSWLYAAELGGAIVGLLGVGPLILTVLPINLLGHVGVATHLSETVEAEGLVSHQSQTSLYARTDFIETRAPAVKYAFTDGMFVTRSVAWDGVSPTFDDAHVEALATLKRLALRIGTVEKVVLLGAGAGFDIAVALQEGAEHVAAVEVNPATVAFARRHDAWAGGVMSHPRADVYVSEARRFMASTDERWDHVSLTLLQTSPAGLRGAQHVDARLLTVEAVKGYLAQLSDTGIIAVIQNTADFAGATEAVLEAAVEHEQGRLLRFVLPEVLEPIRDGVVNNPFAYLVVATSRPFDEAARLRSLSMAGELGVVPVEQFDRPARLALALDDRPFFFEPGPRLVMQTVLTVSLIMLVGVVLLVRRRTVSGTISLALGALLIGAASMGVQVIAVYWCQAAIGNPAQAMGVALAAVLGGSGVGALCFPLVRVRAGWALTACLAAAAVGVALLLGPWMIERLIQQTSLVASIFFGLFLFMVALPLGWPYLAAMDRARQVQGGENLVIAYDGFGGVLGAAGITALAIGAGFSFAGWVVVSALLMLAGLAASSGLTQRLGVA